MWPLVRALSAGGAVSPSGISWWDCQHHFPEPTWRVSARRAEGLSGMGSPKASSPRRGAKRPSLTAGPPGGLSLAAPHARFTGWDAFAVVASEATPAMENRQPASGV